ncbi:MAG: hypothetical protein ABFS35_08430 [Bacteroidota bacterium]
MKKLSIILLAVSLIAFSCNKTDKAEPVSFSLTYDGITYTEAESNSLNMVAGLIAAKGTEGDGLLLTIMGVGADGTTSEVCPDNDCAQSCTVMLDFGAAAGKEAFGATSGTVKRTGKKIEVNVTGLTVTSLETKTLTATINLGTVIL